MKKNKLMEIFDKTYDETMRQILRITPDRDEAKQLLGTIYKETWDSLTYKTNNLEDVRRVFEKSKQKHGIMAAA